MVSLAHELEKDALDPSTQISTLLRKALVAAKKLEDAEFERWVSYELKGYPDDAELPDYRKISGRVVANNPMRGWMPVDFVNLDPELHINMSTFHFRNSIGDIVSMATGTPGTKVTNSVIVYYDKETQQRIMQAMNYPATPGIEYNRSQFRRVLDNVRTAVLEWAVEYQKKMNVETKTETPSEVKPGRKSKLSYINENRAWMFEGLGTQIVVGGITLVGSLVIAYFITKPEPPQVNTLPTMISTPTPTVTPTPTSTPTPTPTPTPKPITNRGRNTKT